MIKSSAQQDHSIMKLLGYKYSCFKCSSEVSSRTYMCEVAASNYIDQVGFVLINISYIFSKFLWFNILIDQVGSKWSIFQTVVKLKLSKTVFDKNLTKQINKIIKV